eukprot:COSAG01_NODE_64113_length_277_cov_2.028090_1_plen_77_part_10
MAITTYSCGYANLRVCEFASLRVCEFASALGKDRTCHSLYVGLRRDPTSFTINNNTYGPTSRTAYILEDLVQMHASW